MINDKSPSKTSENNNLYLKIWEVEQTVTSNRWTVTTFFMSVSFAVFGVSFQSNLVHPFPNIARLSGLLIYWFAFLLFLRFHSYSKYLRSYLEQLEASNKTTLNIQTMAITKLHSGFKRWLSVTRLLFYFGILYSIGVIVLW